MRKFPIKRRLQKLLFILIIYSGQAQENSDSIVSSVILKLNKIWDFHHPKIKPELSFSDVSDSSKTDPFKLKTEDNTNYRLNELLIKAKKKEREIYKKTTGLELFGNYTENFNSPFYESDDNVIFRRRAQMGVDWSIFNNGWYENKIRAKQTDYEIKALKETMVKAGRSKNFNAVKSAIFYSFNKLKTDLLDQRKILSEKHITEAEKLFELKQLTKENYLKILQNKTDISSQLSVYRDYNMAIESALAQNMTELNLPLVDIDLFKVFSASVVPAIDSSWYYKVKKQELEYNKWRKLNLHAQVKYNYFDLVTASTNNRHFVSAGITFGLPLQLTRKPRLELLETEKEIIKLQNTQQNGEINYIILNLCYEYRYKLKQYLNLLEKRNYFYELVRIERVKHEFNDLEFNPSVALLMIDDIYKIDLELLDLKQDMYRHLLEISDKLPDMDINKVIIPVNLIEKNPPIRAVYVWSAALDSLGADFISEYCQLNNFNRIIVSAKPEKAYMKKVNELLSKTNAAVELMVGKNKLLTEGNYLAYFEEIKKEVDFSRVKALHLDIEPHTMDEFKAGKELLFGKYKTMLGVASDFTRQNKILLSVSIPLSYPDDVLKSIDSLCDQIYLMAYENTNEDFIFKKSLEERKIDLKRLVIAQRTKDFSNKVELNEKIKTLIEKLAIKNYAVHDIDDLVKMDEKMIDNQKKNKGK
ncbi:MAG: hypothetical protein IAF38_11175 [Bacteroidia bacterium]|nr:hypothetical protein [Bacteroidia bacterium]